MPKDSMDLLEFILLMEVRFNVELNVDLVNERMTFAEIKAVIAGLEK